MTNNSSYELLLVFKRKLFRKGKYEIKLRYVIKVNYLIDNVGWMLTGVRYTILQKYTTYSFTCFIQYVPISSIYLVKNN